MQGFVQASSEGKFAYWYDPATKNYFTYEVATALIKNITGSIKVTLYDTENDEPGYPDPAGVWGWIENDKSILVNDEYDIWRVDPTGMAQPKNISNSFGRKSKTGFTYTRLDDEKRNIKEDEIILLRSFNKITKFSGYF